jgi:hypothetical protein
MGPRIGAGSPKREKRKSRRRVKRLPDVARCLDWMSAHSAREMASA